MPYFLPLFLIFIASGIFISWFWTFKWSKSGGKANQAALNANQTSPSTLSSYTCGYANLGFCQLYISKDRIWCEQAGNTLFQFAPGEIRIVYYSYWATQFVVGQNKYTISSLLKPMNNNVVGALTRRHLATDKHTLDDFVNTLKSSNIPVQKKIVAQKHVILALSCLAFGVLLIGFSLIKNLLAD